VSIIDLPTRKVTTLPTGARPQGIEFSPDFKRVYVANSDGYGRSPVIDAVTKKLVGDISGGERVIAAGFAWPSGRWQDRSPALQLDHAISFQITATLKERK